MFDKHKLAVNKFDIYTGFSLETNFHTKWRRARRKATSLHRQRTLYLVPFQSLCLCKPKKKTIRFTDSFIENFDTSVLLKVNRFPEGKWQSKEK